jgi:hypothetical protein
MQLPRLHAGRQSKLVGHLGEAAAQRIKNLTELAGVDVILVHRMLKNDVPVPEYMLDDGASARPHQLFDARKVR